jgi:hypothetical protein
MVKVILWRIVNQGSFSSRLLLMKDVVFHVEGNAISSEEYKLKVVAVPTISNFEMQLNYHRI